MEPLDQTPKAKSLDARRRTLLVIWAAMLASVGLYAALAVALRRPEAGDAGEGAEGGTLALVLLAVGCASVLASFIARQRLLSHSVRDQRVELVATAYIIGFALCEAAGLLGLVSALVTPDGFAQLLFIACAAGLLLHFPRRDDFLAAAYDEGRTSITGT